MRILHVIASIAPRYGGPSRACPDLCRALIRRGEDAVIYTTDVDGPGRLDVPLDAPVDVDGVPVHFFPVQQPREYKLSLPLARALRADVAGFDVVHIHSLYLFTSAIAARYAFRAGVPYLVRPHGTLDPYIYRRHRGRKFVYECLVERRNLDRAAGIHFTTEQEALLARPVGLKAPEIVVPNGVDLTRFETLPARGAFRARYPEIGTRRLVLFFGRLNFKKGLDLLARAFGRLVRAGVDAHLALVGPDDDYGPRVRQWLVDEGCLDRATFTGLLDDARSLEALRDADVFALPSYSENFGNSVAEAMAAGLPVVVSDQVNLCDAIRAADAGLVVPCDADAVATAVARVLDDPAGSAAMAARARTLVHERFSWDAVAAEMARVYREIRASGPRAAGARA